jgi:hypothetical protein
MILLDEASTVLPEGIRFLRPGWWVLHVLAAGLVFVYGYRRGRIAERREQKERDRRAAAPREPSSARPPT